ncbi:Translin-associated factor X-interacting protein [Phytophthora infestans]|uniref:Translin-associated factor X-interacting protein n=1 Tax=Phytophthora infestans TaxID=4787 RepID=A0A833SPH5_PHYIN|nr:Translin-associated factor X-interacting protein [Phytophthora infestans]
MLQKLHTRTRLLDDSRTRPALLQELLDYLHTELDGERESRKPSLRRLQIVREALNRLIDGFSVYAPVLMQIRDEYERAVEDLHARNLMIPGLQTRLQSLETHCLQQLSAYSAEAKARSKKRLAETQALLAASTAENARLTAALRSEKDNVTKAESKLTDVQPSSVRRHDESLRARQERSLEDARALQKATARYYHACDEMAELKKTLAALEGQENGEHVAADKNTIVLLSHEVQELCTALTASSPTGKITYIEDL